MTVSPELIDRLRAFGPFRELDAAWLERLAGSAARRELHAGEYVWRGGDTARHFFIVERGLVAIRRMTVDGDGALIALFGPGDTLCVVPALQRFPLPADAVAVADDVSVLVVPAAPVVSGFERHPELALALNRALLDHTATLRNKIDIMSAGTVPRRIAVLLLHLAERFGRTSGDGAVHIDPAVTREQIGQLVGARTETVIRIMSRWAKAGWIQGVAPTLHLLRPDMLRRIARGAAGTKPPNI